MNVDFITAVKMFFANYANFKGRSTRAEFWWAMLFCFLCSAVCSALPGVVSTMLSGILGLVFIIPTLAISTRRMHDTGRSGWYVLAFYVITYGLAIYMMSGLFQAIISADENAIQQAVVNHMGTIGVCSLIVLAISICWLVLLCKPSGPDNKYGPDPYGE